MESEYTDTPLSARCLFFFAHSSWLEDSNALTMFFQMAQDSLQREGQVCDPLLGLSEDWEPASAARGRRCG